LGNVLSFKTGPLVTIDYGEAIGANSLKSLNIALANHFTEIFTGYFNEDKSVATMKCFMDSQSNLFSFIKGEILNKVVLNNYLGDIAKSYAFAINLIKQARIEIYDPWFAMGNLRYQITHNLKISKSKGFSVEFDIIDPTNNKNFKLWLTQHSLLMQNIDLFYIVINKFDGISDYNNIKEIYRNHLIQEAINEVEFYIIKYLEGKTRAYMLYDTGTAIGYQHLVPKLKSDGTLYHATKEAIDYMPKTPAHFDIDLTTREGRNKGRYLLEHIIRIITTTTDIFVFKEDGALIEDKTLGFGVSQLGILRYNQIFSENINQVFSQAGIDPFPYAERNYFEAYQATFDSDLIIDPIRSRKTWLNLFGHSLGSRGDFLKYRKYIFEGTSEYCEYLRNFLVSSF